MIIGKNEFPCFACGTKTFKLYSYGKKKALLPLCSDSCAGVEAEPTGSVDTAAVFDIEETPTVP